MQIALSWKEVHLVRELSSLRSVNCSQRKRVEKLQTNDLHTQAINWLPLLGPNIIKKTGCECYFDQEFCDFFINQEDEDKEVTKFLINAQTSDLLSCPA